MSKVSSILFRGKIVGNGIVNFDSPEQKHYLKDMFPSERGKLTHDNLKIAKHNYYDMGDGSYERKIVISGNCSRNAIWSNDIIAQHPAIMKDVDIRYNVIGSKYGMTRGYMYADKKTTLKRKSPVIITCAEQTSNAVSKFEISTNSGPKVDEDGKSSNALRYDETVGRIEYSFTGAIDLQELPFVSMSEVHDRKAIDGDCEDLFRENLSRDLGSNVPKSKMYVPKREKFVGGIPEDGICLTKDQTATIAEYVLTNILSTKIKRNISWAEVSSLEIKMVRNPIEDTFSSDKGWVPFRGNLELNPEDIDVKYEEFSEEDHKKHKKALEEYHASLKAKEKIDKETKSKARKAKKAEKDEDTCS